MEVDSERPPSIADRWRQATARTSASWPKDPSPTASYSRSCASASPCPTLLLKSHARAPREIQGGDGELRVVFGAANVIHIKALLLKDSSIFVEKAFAKDIKPVVVQAGEWWVLAQAKYKSLPALARSTKLADATITGARVVENERRSPVWVVQTADQALYKFKHPNHAHSLDLSKNINKKLDTVASGGRVRWHRVFLFVLFCDFFIHNFCLFYFRPHTSSAL